MQSWRCGTFNSSRSRYIPGYIMPLSPGPGIMLNLGVREVVGWHHAKENSGDASKALVFCETTWVKHVILDPGLS